MAGALDGAGQLTLVPGTGSGLAPGSNFSFFRYKAAKEINLFVVNFCIFVCAELADFRPGNKPASAGMSTFHIHFIRHRIFLQLEGELVFYFFYF